MYFRISDIGTWFKGLFTPDTFMQSLPILGKGMVGIFIVTGVIILSIMALNYFTAEKKK